MRIGIPKEIKNHEERVGLMPSGVQQFTTAGHQVLVEHNAGVAAGFNDQDYATAGAELVDAAKAWSADMLIKVKEPLAEEYQYFRPGLILYTYLHLAANKELTDTLLAAKVTAIGYETMVGPNGDLPLLVPMSQIAGRVAVQAGAHFLESNNGGKGILLAGVPGVRPGNVVIIGGGVVGVNAAKIAVGLGANVTILDRSAHRLAELEQIFAGRINTLLSNSHTIAQSVQTADLVIGAVLIPGAAAPKLVTKEMIESMEPGSVVVDIPIDQGGIFATTTHATTHDAPTFVSHGVIHYAVANIPGSVPKTATEALSSATTPYGLDIANLGLSKALGNPTIATGLNTYNGQLTEQAVADSLQLPFIPYAPQN